MFIAAKICSALRKACFNVSAVSLQDVPTAVRNVKNKATADADMVASFLVKDSFCVFEEPLQLYTVLFLKLPLLIWFEL